MRWEILRCEWRMRQSGSKEAFCALDMINGLETNAFKYIVIYGNFMTSLLNCNCLYLTISSSIWLLLQPDSIGGFCSFILAHRCPTLLLHRFEWRSDIDHTVIVYSESREHLYLTSTIDALKSYSIYPGVHIQYIKVQLYYQALLDSYT